MSLFYLSALLTLGIFVITGLFIGNNSRESGDFALGGRKSTASGVAGVLLGALVGGASTVGTAQTAYMYGAPAIWFTVGGGIGCLFLGLRFAEPIRESGITTISDFLEKSFGRLGGKISFVSSLSSSVGTFISVCAQFLSCIALLRSLLPLPLWLVSVISAILILGFIMTGGLKSFSKLGAAKIVLLYAVLVLCAAAAVKRGGTFSTITSALPLLPWFNPFGRGLGRELGAVVSMVVGIFTTQIYVQALAAAKDAKTARRGALVSALLMPPMGFLGTWIGLSVRASGIEVTANQVLPWFIMNSFPPLLAGFLWAGIMITVLGCAAGLLLGISTNIAKNLIPQRFAGHGADYAAIHRGIIVLLLSFAALFGIFGQSASILRMAYLGMAMRGAGTFLPFLAELLKPGRVAPCWALASGVGGLAGMSAWAITGMPGDPLFAGLAVAAACIFIGTR